MITQNKGFLHRNHDGALQASNAVVVGSYEHVHAALIGAAAA